MAASKPPCAKVFNRSYFMVIVRDCVGTYTEEGHNAALKRMERFAEIVDSKELIDIWRRLDHRWNVEVRTALEKFRRGDEESGIF